MYNIQWFMTKHLFTMYSRLVHTVRFISFAKGIFDNFFLRFKAVCSHCVTAICIDTYWNRTSQLHRMGMEPIHVQHHTHKCITVTLYEQSHWHPRNQSHSQKNRTVWTSLQSCRNMCMCFQLIESFCSAVVSWYFRETAKHPSSRLNIFYSAENYNFFHSYEYICLKSQCTMWPSDWSFKCFDIGCSLSIVLLSLIQVH